MRTSTPPRGRAAGDDPGLRKGQADQHAAYSHRRIQAPAVWTNDGCGCALKRHSLMGVQFYDLAASDPERRFSPYCWRTKLALMYKGLPFYPVAIYRQGCDRIVRSGTCAGADRRRSCAVRFLDDRALGRAATRFINGWADSVLVAGIVRLVVNDIFAHLGRKRPRLFLREPQEAIWDEAGRHIRGSRCTRGRFS
jgi:hypothetical protein